jgi:hypothetical protein
MLGRLLLVGVLIAGCEASPTSEIDEALTCNVGGAGAFGNACVKAGNPYPVRANPLASPNTTGVRANDIAFGVSLVAVNGKNEGVVVFEAPHAGTYQIYLGTPNIPFRVASSTGASIAPSCVSGITSSECTYLRKVLTYNFTQGQVVRIEFGPTTAVRYVRLFIQSTIEAPATCGPDELDEAELACTASGEGATAINATALATGGAAPFLELDGVYGVRLPASNTTGYAGVVAFRPPAPGTYELYLGTPNIPLRIMGHDTPANAVCTRYIPSAECTYLRRGTSLALRDETYRLEFGPGANSYVRVSFRQVDAPPATTVKLGARQNYVSGNATTAVTAGDLDGDGAPDLAVSATDDAGGATQIDVMRNTNGAFAVASTNPTSAPEETVIADFSGDGIADIAGVANDGQGALPGAYLVGTGNFMYTRTFWGDGRDFIGSLRGADFDEDGTLDLVAPWRDSQNPETNLGGFVITQMPSFAILDEESAFGADTGTAVAGDFDGDGNQDVIAGSRTTGALKLYLGTGSGTVTFATDIAVSASGIRRLLAVDLDANGFDDIVALHVDNTATISYGSVAGFASPETLVVPGNVRGVAAGDFDHDGTLDLAIGNEASSESSQVTIFLATETGFVNTAALDVPNLGSNLAVADFNGDGFDDLAAPAFDSVAIWLSTP